MKLIKKKFKTILLTDIVMIVTIAAFVFFAEKPNEVRGLDVETLTYSTAALKWDASNNAKYYRIYRSNDGKSYKYLDTTAKNRYEDKNLVTGQDYYYAVEAKNGLKSSGFDSGNTIMTTPTLDAPKLDLDTSSGEVKLSYSEVAGADGYEVFRDNKSLGTTKDLSYIDKEIKDEKTHGYSVRAFRYVDNPTYSKKSNTTKGDVNFIDDFSVDADTNSIRISWGNEDGYDTYKIYDGDTLLTETSENSYDIDDYDMERVYDVRLIGFNSEDDTQSPASEKNFKVVEEPMDNETALDAVCKWAIEIAEDDSFHYGNGGAAHHNGCYFCNTQPDVKRRNVVQYKKTYCCNPFVQAAFAHGCEDPTMLGLCRRGGSYIEKNYKASPLFENLGKPDRSSLKKGDVLCCNNGHVMLYVGDGQLCEAANGDDGKDGSSRWRNSISVSELSNNRWNNSSYGVRSVFRYNGQGSGTVRKIKEVDKNTGEIIEEKKESTESDTADKTET